MKPGVQLRCFGCGATPAAANPFVCPNRGQGDVDHVIRRHLVGEHPLDTMQTEPFLRYRRRLASWHLGRAAGGTDPVWVARVKALDHAIADLDGHGFRVAPVVELSELAELVEVGSIEAKVEIGNVSGSHKARHLFGLALHLHGKLTPSEAQPLAIASCGNAALAAAVVARAAGWPLKVFIPVDAPEPVVKRLHALYADVQVCERQPGVAGDPTYHAFQAAVQAGALPFCCQGPDNGMAIEGGMTLGYEWIEHWAKTGVVPDHLVIQVGGGALGSALAAAIAEAVADGAIPRAPTLHVVQTEGAGPMLRALDALASTGEAVAQAVTHRSDFMWPWETTPASIAHGILDDETYDWAALAEQVQATGGRGVRVSEAQLQEAHDYAHEVGIKSCVTGAAGLAGLMALVAQGHIGPTDRVAILFSGVDREEAHR